MKYLKFKDLKVGDRISQDVYPEEAFFVDSKNKWDVILVFHPPIKPEEYMQLTSGAFDRMRFVRVIDIFKKRKKFGLKEDV